MALQFNSPDELRAYTEQHLESDNETLDVELFLLQPLWDTRLLPPQRRKSKDEEDELLGLSELRMLWRQQWAPLIKKFRAQLTSITFDATPPTYRREDGVERKTYIQRDRGDAENDPVIQLSINVQKYIDLVLLLATEARMVRGSGVLKFDVSRVALFRGGSNFAVQLQKKLDKLGT